MYTMLRAKTRIPQCTYTPTFAQQWCRGEARRRRARGSGIPPRGAWRALMSLYRMMRRIPAFDSRLHERKMSEVLAEFFDRRWDPLAAPPAPPLARSACQGGGASADLRGPPQV
ncbi:unnamed protein product [Prorocentrum cordatum]|uniref:Uncharacterized protein n=1 Tax=Prorocentrum cordatum TaxID=2364126 RepID=A0ABN9QNN7_9DINO|nr:unnamed protein product [Polarella glacialis]